MLDAALFLVLAAVPSAAPAAGPPVDITRPLVHDVTMSVDVGPARDVLTLLEGRPEAPAALRRLRESRPFRLALARNGGNPDDVLGRLGEFLGLGPIAAPENFRAREHHILGNKMRMGSSGVSDGTGRIRHDERWREALSPEAVAAVVRVAGPMARSLGYDL